MHIDLELTLRNIIKHILSSGGGVHLEEVN